MNEFSSVVVERLEKEISDHCPQMLNFTPNTPRKGWFKFYNVLAEHEHFEQLVKENWVAGGLKTVKRCLGEMSEIERTFEAVKFSVVCQNN